MGAWGVATCFYYGRHYELRQMLQMGIAKGFLPHDYNIRHYELQQMLWIGTKGGCGLFSGLLKTRATEQSSSMLSMGQKSKLGNKRPPVGRKVRKLVKQNVAESEPYNQLRVQPQVVKVYINQELCTSTGGRQILLRILQLTSTQHYITLFRPRAVYCNRGNESRFNIFIALAVLFTLCSFCNCKLSYVYTGCGQSSSSRFLT